MNGALISWVLLGALACVPPPVAPTLPAAPVLEGDGMVSIFREFILMGSAPEGTLVRLYLDEACRGPAWRDLTAEELGAGVLINLVGGTENVFAAVAIDTRGAVSDCSAAIRVRFERPRLPQQPDATVTPALPTRETHFVIKGRATDAASVRLFELGGGCSGVPVATLSEADYAARGFEIDVPPNVYRPFILDAVNRLGEASNCVTTVGLLSDQLAPTVTAALLSPTPSPDRLAFIEITHETVDRGAAFLGPGCVGPTLITCNGSGCRLLTVNFPAVPEQYWSASAVDTAGNQSPCVDSVDPWRWDPAAPFPAVQLTSSEGRVRGLAPARSPFVEIYAGPTCDVAQLLARPPSSDFASFGHNTAAFSEVSDGGVLTARSSTDFLSTDEPCSAPVPWY